MKVLVGARNGPLKLLSLDTAKTELEIALPAGVAEVERMAWGPGADAAARESLVMVAASGKLLAVDLLSGTVSERGTYADGPARMLSLTSPTSTDVVVVTEGGEAILYPGAASLAKPEPSDDAEGAQGQRVVARVKGPVHCACLGDWGKRGLVVALGGRERELSVWSVAKSRELWHSRNVPNDKLDLRRPVWHAACFFLPSDPLVLVVGTAYKEFRMYDTRKGAQPIVNAEIFPNSVTGCTVSPADPEGAWFTTAHGDVVRVHIERKRVEGSLKGIAGAQRAVCVHESDPVIATCGIDRFVYVWNSKTRSLQKKIYVKLMATAMLMLSEEAPKPPKKGKKAVIDADRLWESIAYAGIDEEVAEDGEVVEAKKKIKRSASDDEGSDDDGEPSADDDSDDEEDMVRGGGGRGRGRGGRGGRGRRPAAKKRRT
eukprot:m51a1_g31 putative wd repeat-containing protein 74 (430) ;mRNA; r:126403-127829